MLPGALGASLSDIAAALRVPDRGERLQRLPMLALLAVPGVTAASLTVVRDGIPASPATTGDVAAALDAAQYESGSGPCIEAARLGQVVAMPNARAETRWPQYVRSALDHGTLSSLSVPIVEPDRVTGRPAASLNLYAPRAGMFNRVAQQHGKAMAVLAAMAMRAEGPPDSAEHADDLERAWHAGEVVSRAQQAVADARGCDLSAAFAVLLERAQADGLSLPEVAGAVLRETDEAPGSTASA